MMKRSAPCPVHSRKASAHCVSSEDGEIAFTLTRVPAGLAVERVAHRAGRARVVQTTLFRDHASFGRWCAADATRFAYPLVHSRLKRDADALFSA